MKTLALSTLLRGSGHRPVQRAGFVSAGSGAAGAAGPAQALMTDLRSKARLDGVARVVSNRIFALERSGLPTASLAEVARRELSAGTNPYAAWTDSLALACLAAQRALGLRPHLVQLGAAIHAWSGQAAELGPGEGKTLALALAACVHALAGRPVQVVHRDDAAAVRAIAQVRRLFQELGVPVRLVTAASQPPERRNAYGASVCYVAARELLFDALEDADALGFRPPNSVCAMVDDLDQVLIDGAAATYRLTRDQGGEQDPSDGAARIGSADLTMTPQRLFRRYAVLGGLSSTLQDTEPELQTVYGLTSARIPSIYPDFGKDVGIRVFGGLERLDAALLERVRAHTAARRPVLVIAGMRRAMLGHAQGLAEAGFDALVLDDPLARPQSLSLAAAEAMSPFGLTEPMRMFVKPGAVMVCTEDDAQTLDLVLEAGARAAGGIAVIVVGLGQNARADRRLRHVVVRQGHPGSIEFLVDGRAPFRSPLPIRSVADRLSGLPLPAWVAVPLIVARRRRHEHGVMRARLRLSRRAAPSDGSTWHPTPAPPIELPLPLASGLRTP